ncbi:exodeoxyribonuclease VIII [Vibrio phage JSF12]|uniref:Exodeoxyribonuclease VIII n=2 Tax=Jesfedecavirus TaxID=2560156 RepID=A0A2D0YLQ0_9CAUD|nr:exodeoxyribonuclease VIII [Vibrio phage JSF10]YP_009794702.1 exodeoxyribonuclease VIII [Vibrio phage JSF12]ASV43410.1 exodeoxyribonuclease VIII [Vibrio phage JSF10]ASV43537.1 exodeoxyribonuclease VIII [Vibrio phage JSF12]
MLENILGNVDKTKLYLSPTDHLHLNWVFDLETLATEANSIVTEVSAVGFNLLSGEIVAEKTWHLDIDCQVQLGRVVSGGTIAFWLMQSEEAREKVAHASSEYCKRNGLPMPLPVGGFVLQLAHFLKTTSEAWAAEDLENRNPQPLVWGNGITFDLGKLHSLIRSVYGNDIWNYSAERDARTYCGLAPSVKQAFWSDFRGIEHYGLDDCKHEIRYLVTIYNLICGGLEDKQ